MRKNMSELVNFGDGCWYYDRCLTCPFVKCVVDIGPSELENRIRGEEARRRRARGETLPQIARSMGLSKRTISRALPAEPARLARSA